MAALLHLVVEQEASKLSVASATTCPHESFVRPQPPLSYNITNVTHLFFVDHTTPRLSAIFVTSNAPPFRLSIALSPSRRPAARRQTQSTIFANLTRPLCAAAQRLCPAQALAIRATRGDTQTGTSSAKRFELSSHTASCRHPPLPPRRQTQPAILAASQGL